ncbi:MAG: CDP-alcohol phosphatidyltransferase family protein [Clostridia bacterium]|nr:CDP-alcohol phosphatidyltransferase family protein [Clostridia bacterium]
MREKLLTVPNIITAFRLIGSLVLLLFIPTYSTAFFIIYTLCGISDVVDGTIARITKSTTEFGAKLDSIADLLFYSVLFFCIFPDLLEKLPLYVWIMGFTALFIRLASYLTAAIKHRRFASVHTYMNKLTGVVVFSVPYFVITKFIVQACFVLGIISITAAIEEFIMHITSEKYNPNKKTLLPLKQK